MDKYEEGLKLLEEKFGNGKDNLISLATIGQEPGDKGKPRPVVRDVDAYYDNDVFYVTTYGKSNKMHVKHQPLGKIISYGFCEQGNYGE